MQLSERVKENKKFLFSKFKKRKDSCSEPQASNHRTSLKLSPSNSNCFALIAMPLEVSQSVTAPRICKAASQPQPHSRNHQWSSFFSCFWQSTNPYMSQPEVSQSVKHFQFWKSANLWNPHFSKPYISVLFCSETVFINITLFCLASGKLCFTVPRIRDVVSSFNIWRFHWENVDYLIIPTLTL